MEREIVIRCKSSTETEKLLNFVARAVYSCFDNFTIRESGGQEYKYDPYGDDEGNHVGHDKALLPVSSSASASAVPAQGSLFPPVEERAPLQ